MSRLPQALGDRIHGILAQGRDEGDNHDAHDHSKGQGVKSRQGWDKGLEQRGDKKEGEIAVHHGGNAREDFQYGFGLSSDRLRGKFAQVDGAHEPHWHGYEDRNGRCEEGPGEKRQDAKMLLGKKGSPLSVCQKFKNGHLCEELDGLKDEDRHDAKRGEKRQRATEKEYELEGPLANPLPPRA